MINYKQMFLNMKTRCNSFESYKRKGIAIYPAWLETPELFYNYIKNELGPCPEGYSLDRINNDNNYEPGNLRWASAKQQSANRENTYYVTFLGQKLPLADLCREYNIELSVVRHRLERGLNLINALTDKITKRDKITINNKSKTLAEWCRINGISYYTAHARITKMNWDPIRAVTTQPRRLKGTNC